jgi:hypothetical protein
MVSSVQIHTHLLGSISKLSAKPEEGPDEVKSDIKNTSISPFTPFLPQTYIILSVSIPESNMVQMWPYTVWTRMPNEKRFIFFNTKTTI